MANAFITIRNSFSPLQYANFRTYIGGQAISLIGTWLQVTAIGWVVWTLTGSEAALGTVNMLNTLPLLLLTPYAGVIADRVDRRKLLIFTQIGMMLSAFIVAALVQSGNVQVWHIYGMAIVLGVLSTLDLPAQQAFLGDLSGMGEVRKAVNMNAMVIQVSRMVGPAVAGLVVARLGAAPAFWLNGISFLVVIGSLVIVRAAQAQPKSKHSSVLTQLRASLAFVGTQPRILDMFALALMITFFSWAIIFNVLPSVADEVLKGDAQTLGALMSASGAGALVSVLLLVPLAQAYKRPGWVMAMAGIFSGVTMLIFGVSQSLPLSLLALFISSLGNPIIFTMGLGLTQLMAPAEMRARVISLFTLVSFGMQPFAALFIGNMAEHFGTQTAILVNASLLVIGITALMLLRPGLRDWEVKNKPTQPADALIEAAVH